MLLHHTSITNSRSTCIPYAAGALDGVSVGSGRGKDSSTKGGAVPKAKGYLPPGTWLDTSHYIAPEETRHYIAASAASLVYRDHLGRQSATWSS